MLTFNRGSRGDFLQVGGLGLGGLTPAKTDEIST